MALRAVAVLLFVAGAPQAIARSEPDADVLAILRKHRVIIPRGKAFT